ncbi:MAG: SufD family Fe-S cluster assembly protein [Porphyromonas sp.]|nr:SufD family Fe-S cluster assembly protein [Porphyromonas sp.]
MSTTTITQSFLARAEQLPREGVPFLILKARDEARKLLTNTPLPRTGAEAYQKFDIDALLSYPWELNISRPAEAVDVEDHHACPILTEDAISCMITEEQVAIQGEVPEGVFIGRLSQFAELYPEQAERYFNQAPDLKTDPLSALNTLLLQDAFVLYVGKGVELEQAVHMMHYTAVIPGREELTTPRILWIGEEGSSSTLLICDHSYDAGTKSLRNGVIELYAGKDSHHRLYDMEENSILSNRLRSVHVVQEEGSKVLIDNMTVQNGTTRNNFFCHLNGERATIDLDGLCILDGEQVADNWCQVHHNVPNCMSDQLFKYTVNDSARGNFSGMIYVEQNAQKTEAYQSNRNLLLSKTAKMYSKPQLEIYADDVRCTHGMTTGELDETQLFYLRQRGISKVEAKLILTIAFMSDVLDKIEIPSLRKRLSAIVEQRYRGIPAYCKEE